MTKERYKVKPDSQFTLNYDIGYDVLYLSKGTPTPSYTDNSGYIGPGRIMNRHSMGSTTNTTSEYTEPEITGATIIGYSQIDRENLIRFVQMSVDWEAIDKNIKKIKSNEKQLLINFIASLTLCDHMGDVMDDARKVLKKLGVEEEWHDEQELIEVLKNNFDGVQTVYETEV